MPLDKTSLQVAIKETFLSMLQKQTDPEQAIEELSTKLAEAIDVYVKTGTVTTIGGPTTQTGTIT